MSPIPFFYGRHDETSDTSFVANSRGTCEMLRRGLQDFPSHPTSRRAQKSREKVSVKVRTVAPGQNRFHVGASNSCSPTHWQA